MIRSCTTHGDLEFKIIGQGKHARLRCPKCASEAVSKRRRTVKALLVEEAGGKCSICGYNRCVRALEFHHLDPSKKDFGISHRGVTRSISLAREEVSKCILVCSNCHAELHSV